MAFVGFAVAALASLGFAAWFVTIENNSPGLSFGVALIGMPLLLAVFGLSKSLGGGVTEDGKGAGWAAIGIAIVGVGYMGLFFGSWLMVSVAWIGLFIPMLIAIMVSPTTD